MHIAFLNPQGNFDPEDSHLTEHPDFGGQLVYVKELALAMAELGHRVDIVTRRIDDPDWPEFARPIEHYPGVDHSPRILRIDCGGPRFLNKERLWDHLEEFVRNLLAFYGDQRPDFATAHYADGGYCAALLKSASGIGFTFTGHSLGAQKLDKLGTTLDNLEDMEQRFHFSQRIAAECLSIAEAYRIITSTEQERREQYAHPLYRGALSPGDENKFSVVPPGVNTRVFTHKTAQDDAPLNRKLDQSLGDCAKHFVLVSSRLDEKKNILGVAKAFAANAALRDAAHLVICIRGLDDPYQEVQSLKEPERSILSEILTTIVEAGFRDQVHFLNIQSQHDLAATYRYFAARGSVFALTAFYEPFGLAPIEAAACGLACVATMNGGPSEIFADGSGILVDPFDQDDIARGLLEALKRSEELSARARQRVVTTYTWRNTATGYLSVIEAGLAVQHLASDPPASLDARQELLDYLTVV